MRNMLRVFLTLVSVGGILFVATTAWAQETSVSIIDNDFDPSQIEISAGDTVTWTNSGTSPHTVTASDGSFGSGNLNPGETYNETFATAGTFAYYCEYHGTQEGEGMAGTITVVTGNGGGGGNGDPGNGEEEGSDANRDLPETGSEVGAFLYIGLVFVAAGFALARLGRDAV